MSAPVSGSPTSSGELLAAVLPRIETDLADLPGAGDGTWRGRVADEAALLLALLRAPDGGWLDPGSEVDVDEPEDAALTAHVREMTARGVPPRAVQRFVRAAGAAVFAELWHRAGPGDATAVLRASRLLAARGRVAERVLQPDYGSMSAAPAPSTRTMEVV